MTTLPLAPATASHLWGILAAVSRVCAVRTEEILGDSRFGRIVLPRQILCYVARERGFTCTEIARFGRRDHTTVLYAVRHIGEIRLVRPDVDEMIRQIVGMLDTPAETPPPPEPPSAAMPIDRVPLHPTYIIEFEDVVRTGNHEVYMRRMLKEALRKFGFKARSVKSLTPPALAVQT